jgi:hypothetical protein
VRDPRATVAGWRRQYAEHADDVPAAFVTAKRDDDERGSVARRERRRSSVGERARPKELDGNAASLELGNLIDEHRDASTPREGFASGDERALGGHQAETVGRASLSHEAIEPFLANGLRDDEQIQ